MSRSTRISTFSRRSDSLTEISAAASTIFSETSSKLKKSTVMNQRSRTSSNNSKKIAATSKRRSPRRASDSRKFDNNAKSVSSQKKRCTAKSSRWMSRAGFCATWRIDHAITDLRKERRRTNQLLPRRSPRLRSLRTAASVSRLLLRDVEGCAQPRHRPSMS